MKTTKFFLMAALALTFAACSNDDNDILNPAQTAKGEGITITATLAPKDAGATTRAVSEGTGEDAGDIVTTWAVNEHIAILYDKDGAQMADATIKSVDASGTATIEFSVVDGTADNTACTLVYPYSAAKTDKSGVKDAATLLASQNGTLNANLDVRVGAGKIQITTPGLDVTTQPAAQFAIFKFSVKNSNASATISVKPLTITIGTQDYVITPSTATSTLYAALPAVSGQAVSFSATGSDSKTYVFSKDGVTFTAGKYYQSTLKMAKVLTYPVALSAVTADYVGSVVTTDCNVYAKVSEIPAGKTAAAMIAYVSGTGTGLAIALANEGEMDWNSAKSTCEGKTKIGGKSWKLPSEDEWKQMFSANGGNDGSYTGLNTAITTAGGTALQENEYWSSSEGGDWDSDDGYYGAYCVDFYAVSANWSTPSKGDSYRVRAVLAF